MNTKPSASTLSSRLKGRGLNRDKIFLIMERAGNAGVKALKEATPVKTGHTATEWTYTVNKDLTLTFKNTEVTAYGVPIPILIMYGYMRGRRHIAGNDFVRRTLDPIIRSMKDEIRREML